MDHVAQGFEALGALILVIGVLSSFVLAGLAWRPPGSPKQAYTVLRQAFGGTLLLALEVLVAADLIRTVAVSPTLDNVLVLGLIVLIRTFLSFSLEVEIDGTLPWRRAGASGAATIKQAAQTALGATRREKDPGGRESPPLVRDKGIELSRTSAGDSPRVKLSAALKARVGSTSSPAVARSAEVAGCRCMVATHGSPRKSPRAATNCTAATHRLKHASAVYGAFGTVIGIVAFLLVLAKLSMYAAELNPVLARRLYPRALPLGGPGAGLRPAVSDWSGFPCILGL